MCLCGSALLQNLYISASQLSRDRTRAHLRPSLDSWRNSLQSRRHALSATNIKAFISNLHRSLHEQDGDSLHGHQFPPDLHDLPRLSPSITPPRSEKQASLPVRIHEPCSPPDLGWAQHHLVDPLSSTLARAQNPPQIER